MTWPFPGSGPGPTTPTTFPQPQQQQNGWQQWLPLITGTGAGLLSSYLQNRSIQQQNQALQQRTQQLDQLAQQEQARRDYYSSILMPNILRGLGQKNPQVMAEARRRMLMNAGGANLMPTSPDVSGGGYDPGGYSARNGGPSSYAATFARASGQPYSDPNDPDAWRRE